MPSLLDHFRSRARLIAACVLLALITHVWDGGAIAPGEAGLREALGKAVGATVLDFTWEPNRSVVSEWVWGRPVLFLSQADNSPRELFRGFVRMSPEGSPLEVSRVRNLSQTDLGDEDQLTVGTLLAAFRSRDRQGRVTLSLLDLRGTHLPHGLGLLQRLQSTLSQLVQFGDARGLGRTDFVFTAPGSLKLRRKRDAILVSTDSQESTIPIARLMAGPEDVDIGAELLVLKREHEPVPLLHWAANLGRSLMGTAAIARLEEVVFTAKDWITRTRYAATHDKSHQRQAPDARSALSKTHSDPAARSEIQKSPTFPPGDIGSVWPVPEEGEGVWTAAGQKLTQRAGEPPLFYRTFVRPDSDRPYAKHHLVVMDMSRLELGIRAGYEDPQPRTGPPGSGHVPKDPEVFSRIVATFNGAFKLSHGAYGMKAEGRVLIPPREGAATVLIDPSGRVGIGSAQRRPGQEELLGDAVAYRQNLDLLLREGRLLPTGRKDWGDHLVGSGVAAERTGLCVTESGHLIYAWSEEATARSLARGMQLAGCTAAIHLDMNPGHCAFTFNRIENFQPLVAEGEPLSRAMRINPNRFLRWSPKDFFYIARREAFPQREPLSSLDWRAAAGSKKAGLPAVIVGTKTVAGITIEVDRVDLDRVRLSVLPRESNPALGEPRELSQPPLGSFSWSLGHATRGTRTGLSSGLVQLKPMSRKFSTLVLPTRASPKVEPPGAPLEPRSETDLVQLPLLAREGQLTDAARRLTGRRTHGALCLDEEGHLLVGRMEHDTPAPLVMTLTDLGCRTVLETDRGSHPPARAFRPEALSESQADSDPGLDAGTLLIAELRPAEARAYEF